MKLVKLKDINLIYSNISEDAYSEYDSSATYNTGDRVYVTKESNGTTERIPHEIYESLADNNTGNYPPDSPDKWGFISATNRWKMFDKYTNTQTKGEIISSYEFTGSKIEVVVDFSFCDTFALFNLQGNTVRWYLYDGDYTNSSNIVTSGIIELAEPVGNWYEYFYGDIEYRDEVYINNIPIYRNGQLKVVITRPIPEEKLDHGPIEETDYAKCGMLCVGREVFLGLTQYDVNISISDYSRKKVDEWGNVYLKKGNYAKKVECDFWLETGQVDFVRKKLADVRATPTVFNVNNDTLQDKSFSSLIVYGFYKDFNIIIPGHSYSKCSLEIEGII